MYFRTAIVNELGEVVFWRDEVQDEYQFQCILESHPEWTVRCVVEDVMDQNMEVD